MEAIAIVLTSLLGLAGTPGIIIDQMGADLLRQQVHRVEKLELRIESAPNYQILLGTVDRIRLASRGVYPNEFLRIDTLEVETDPISIDPNALQLGRISLRRPLQAAARVILRAEDINNALRSPQILRAFQGLEIDLGGGRIDKFDLIDPEVIFVSGNLLRLRMRLRPADPARTTLAIEAETRLNLIGGRRIQLERVSLNLQGVPFPQEILDRFTENLNSILDLQQLEARNILARVLKLEITDRKLQVIGFVRIDRLE